MKALGFAVGLRSVRAGEFVLELQPSARRREALRAESRTIAGEDPAYRYTELSEIADDGMQEGNGAGAAFIGFHLSKADARAIVDGNKQVFPSADRVTRAFGNTLEPPRDSRRLHSLRGVLVQTDAYLLWNLNEVVHHATD